MLDCYGDTRRRFPLASVTKPLVARAAQVAIEEGAVELDTEAGPPGSTVRHLLAHTVGRDDDSEGDRRAGHPPHLLQLRVRGARRGDRAGDVIAFATYLAEAVLEPLGMTDTVLDGGTEAAGYGGTSTVEDLVSFAGDLLVPAPVSEQMHAEATTVQFPGLYGVLPGFGVQRPNDWGLGFEIRGGKSPHWTGAANSARTFGHFGQSGTFLWVDPDAELALVVLTDRKFGEWAHSVMPALSDEVLREFGAD